MTLLIYKPSFHIISDQVSVKYVHTLDTGDAVAFLEPVYRSAPFERAIAAARAEYNVVRKLRQVRTLDGSIVWEKTSIPEHEWPSLKYVKAILEIVEQTPLFVVTPSSAPTLTSSPSRRNARFGRQSP